MADDAKDVGVKVGGVQVGPGIGSKPAIAFQQDDDTGFGLIAPGIIGVYAAGAEVGRLPDDLGAGDPAGADTQVQFNDAGVFGGDAGLTYNKTTDSLTIVGGLTVNGNTTLGDAIGDSLTVNGETFSAPNWPAFFAYASGTDVNQTGNNATAQVTFATEVFDQGGNFAANTFTAPTTGRYLLATTVLIVDLSTAAITSEVFIVTSNRSYLQQYDLNPKAGALECGNTMAVVADMDAGDTAIVQVRVAGMVGNTADIFGSASLYTHFSGHQVA